MLVGVSVVVVWPAQAAAQTAQPNTLTILEEIVVTAQKREEGIQTVPVSVSVIGGAQLESLGATQLQDYIAYLPGVIVDSGGAPGLATISIRGLSPAAGGTTLVGTYIDDTPVGSSGAWAQESSFSLDLMPYDLERIEILRGPQGTLYGANSMGGLLKYVTRSPLLDQFDAHVGGDIFGIENGDQTGWGGRFSLNAPLVEDKLGLRVSGYKHKAPGYVDNPQLGTHGENANDQYGGRAAALWQPAPALSIKGQAIIQRIRADGVGLVNRSLAGVPLAGDLTYPHPIGEPFKRDLDYYSLTANWDLGWATAVSATGYSQSKVELTSDFTASFGTLVPLFTGGAANPGFSAFSREFVIRRTTQELRLASPSGGRFEWLVGTYYSREKTQNHQDLSALAPGLAPVAGLDPFVLASIPADFKEIAAFTNETFKITDRFDISAGARWARNTQDFLQIVSGSLLAAASTPGDSRQSVWTWAVSPRYQFTNAGMVYLRVATGYRPGGPNVALPGVPPQVNADRTRNYEAGYKATFANGRALLNAAIFRTDWTDIQLLLSNASGIQYFSNANDARVKGVELASSFIPHPALSISLGAAYLDGKLTNDVPLLGFRNGARLPATPKWTASATADYSVQFAADWTTDFGAGIRYVSSRLNGVGGTTPPLEEAAYSPIDLYVRIEHAAWNARLYVRNALDQRRYVSEGRVQDLLGQNPAFLQGAVLEPRTIGFSIDRAF